MQPGSPWYRLASETARRFGQATWAVIAGAGPGVMEAANKGARQAKTLSIGLNIELPEEQGVNEFVDRVIKTMVQREGHIDEAALALPYLTDDPEDAFRYATSSVGT